MMCFSELFMSWAVSVLNNGAAKGYWSRTHVCIAFAATASRWLRHSIYIELSKVQRSAQHEWMMYKFLNILRIAPHKPVKLTLVA